MILILKPTQSIIYTKRYSRFLRETMGQVPQHPWQWNLFFKIILKGCWATEQTVRCWSRKGISSCPGHSNCWARGTKRALWSTQSQPSTPRRWLWGEGIRKPFLVIKHLLGLAHLSPVGASLWDSNRAFLLISISVQCRRKQIHGHTHHLATLLFLEEGRGTDRKMQKVRQLF